MSNILQFTGKNRRVVVTSDWRTDFIAIANYFTATAEATNQSLWVRAIADEVRRVARQ